MSRTVSFRCSEELDEFLEEEAERRMTTKSAVAQMIVAEYARSVSQDEATSNEPVTPPEARHAAPEGVNADPFEEVTGAEFTSKSAADDARDEFSQYVSDKDDKRLKVVYFKEGTPAEVVEKLDRLSDGFTAYDPQSSD
jgi:predicted transcriptional regulator